MPATIGRFVDRQSVTARPPANTAAPTRPMTPIASLMWRTRSAKTQTLDALGSGTAPITSYGCQAISGVAPT